MHLVLPPAEMQDGNGKQTTICVLTPPDVASDRQVLAPVSDVCEGLHGVLVTPGVLRRGLTPAYGRSCVKHSKARVPDVCSAPVQQWRAPWHA